MERKIKAPVFVGVVTVVLYMVLLRVAGRMVPGAIQGEYAQQLFCEVVVIIFLLLVLFAVGKGNILWKKGRGFFYAIGVSAFLVTISFGTLGNGVIENIVTMDGEFQATLSVGKIITFIVCMVSVGLAEELALRGILTNLLIERFGIDSVKNVWFIVFFQGMVFGICHLSNIFSGVSVESAVVQAVITCLLGFMFGAIYLRTGSIWSVIFLHAFIDFCSLFSSGVYGADSAAEAINGYSYTNLVVTPVYLLICLFLLRPQKCQEVIGSSIGEISKGMKWLKGVLCTIVAVGWVVLLVLSSIYLNWYGTLLPKLDVVSTKDIPSSYINETNNIFEYQEENDCAAYAMAYVMRNHGESAQALRVYRSLIPKNDDGTVAAGVVAKSLRDKGYTSDYGYGSIESLKAHVSSGNPVIVYLHSSHNSATYHFSVVVGYDEDNIYLADSYMFTGEMVYDQKHYNRVLSIDSFEDLWTVSGSKLGNHFYITAEK